MPKQWTEVSIIHRLASATSMILICTYFGTALLLSYIPQVFQIPPAGTKAKTSAALPFSMKNDSDLSDVARATRRELRAAFACRFTARVWDSTTADPMFYRDAAVILVPSFSSAKHLDMLKLKDGDDAGLPAAKKALVPTTSDEVKFLRDQVWDEIRERAVKATLVEGARNEDMVRAREKKRVKVSATSEASSTGNSAWAMFEERENTDQDNGSPQAQEARRVADAGKAVDEEIQRFKDLNLPPGSIPPRNALVFWSGSAKTQFPKLWRVAQQVYGNQASAAQIEREFGGAGQLLTSRSSREDSMYIEMMLFLHLNFKQIPQQVPSVKSKTLNNLLPKRFTGSNEEFEKAMRYVNSDMPGAVDTQTKEENR